MTKRDITTVSFASKRAQVLKKCKTENKEYSGTQLNTVATEQEVPAEEFPDKCKMYDAEELDIAIYRNKKKESLPKVIRKDDKRKTNVTMWLPPMKVVYSDLGKNGNLGKFHQDPSKAKFMVTLEPGAPDSIKDLREKYQELGEKAIEFIKSTCDKAMGVAYHDEDTWKNVCKDYDDDKAFIEGAQHSVVKTIDNDEGEREVISLGRRLEGWSGEPNRPVFWRLTKDDRHEQVHPKFIRKGAILKCQITFRTYKIPGGRYGVAGDLGKHILVVYSPKPDQKKPERTSTPDVPYIPFELDE